MASYLFFIFLELALERPPYRFGLARDAEEEPWRAAALLAEITISEVAGLAPFSTATSV